MIRTCCLLNAVTIAVMSLIFACRDSSNEESEHWRVIITRADGTTEIHPSLDPPIICDQQEEPRMVFLCGTRYVEGQSLPIAWDFLPVYIGAGDTYTVETPAWLTPEPTPTTPTPTVISP
jgi:hypothetical protein